jgi:hypothetical protein
VVIQGDVIYDLPALLVNVFKIPKSVIFFLEDGKLVSIESKAEGLRCMELCGKVVILVGENATRERHKEVVSEITMTMLGT